MCLPVTKAHPAEVVFAVETLHVIAPAVLLNADAAFGTLKKKRLVYMTKLARPNGVLSSTNLA